VAAQLTGAGIRARAVDLGLGDGGDLADFCMLHGAESLDALRTLPEIQPAANAPDRLPSAASTRPRWVPMDFEDMRKIPPARFLIPNGIVQGGVNFIYGPPGAGKTFLALHYALTLAQDSRVVYVVGEGAPGMYARGKAWLSHHGGHSRHLRMAVGQVVIMDDFEFERFFNWLRGECPAVIFIDTLAASFEGGKENDASDAQLFMSRCAMMCQELSATVCVIHHSSKYSLTERGSMVFRASADLSMLVTQVDGEITVEFVKVKDADMPQDQTYGLRKMTVTIEEDGQPVQKDTVVIVPADEIVSLPTDDLTSQSRRVLEVFSPAVLDGAATVGEVAEMIPSMLKQSVQRILSRLKQRGMLAQSAPRAAYTLTDAGRAAFGIYPVSADAKPDEKPAKPVKAKRKANTEPLPEYSDYSDADVYGNTALPGMDVPVAYESAYGMTLQSAQPAPWGD
jgi:hypothetical protein